MGFEPMTSVIKKVQACSGFEPYWPKLFFRPCFPYFSSSAHDCEDRFHIHAFIRNSNMTFIYSQPFIHHLTDLFATNTMTSSRLAC